MQGGERSTCAWPSDDGVCKSLPDARLQRRASSIAEAAARKPEMDFPGIMSDEAELEGTYRFLGNERVDWATLIDPHLRETVSRCQGYGRVCVLHDTTEFRYNGKRVPPEMGALAGPGNARGFYGHFSLAAVVQDRDPLGVLAIKCWTRTGKKQKLTPKQRREDPERESLRWAEMAMKTNAALEGVEQVVHVMDREADSYETLTELAHEGVDFVIRAHYDREVRLGNGTWVRLFDLAETISYGPTRTIDLSPRAPKTCKKADKIHPARKKRTANIGFASRRVAIHRSSYSTSSTPHVLELNVVFVRERRTPAGEKPILWILLTTLEAADEQHLTEVVDTYRLRWLIEEYFKALKTGCRAEKRQLQSARSMLNALAIFVPIAWNILRLRALSRQKHQRPARELLTATQTKVLETVPRKGLQPDATVADALLVIAGMGGHLKRNGEPGWLTIARGFEELLTLEIGFLAGAATFNNGPAS